MSETIILDKPEHINAWYVLSMYSRLILQTKGIKTPHLIATLQDRGYITARTAKAAIPQFEAYMDAAGINYSRFKK